MTTIPLARFAGTAFWAVSFQACVQAAGFLAGLLIVRWLPPGQYALYTIVVAGAGAVTAIGDGGLFHGLLAQGGPVWTDSARLGAVLATGRQLRRWQLALTLALGLPLIWVLLRRQGAGAVDATLLVLAMLLPLLPSMMASFWEVVPRLHQELRPLQSAQLLSAGARALITAVSVALQPVAAMAVLAPTLPAIWMNWRLRRLALRHVDPAAVPDPAIAGRLRQQVIRSLPDAVYYAVSGQIPIWLLCLFGRPQGIAAIGALGRILMVLTVISSAFSLVIVPRFARLPQKSDQQIRPHYWASKGALAFACLLPVALVVAAPADALRLLGPHYAGFEAEMRLMAVAALVATLGAAAFNLGAARGILAPPWVAIPAGLGIQSLLVSLLPMASVAGVIWLGLASSTLQWAIQAGYFMYRTRDTARGCAGAESQAR